MFLKLKQKLCKHTDVTQSYKFQDRFTIDLPDGRVFTLVGKFLTVTHKCARCGKVIKNEIVYELSK